MIKKITKITALVLASILILIILLLGGYLIYISAQYYRIEDNLNLTINNNNSNTINLQTQYSVTTYNIGFGAYNHDFSFFLDSGKMKSGKEVVGKNSTAKNKQVVLDNTNGVINISKQLNSDFYLFQEVDINGTRSHHINQFEMLNSIGNFTSTYAENFHSAFLLYPFNDFHGKNQAGLVTFSKYGIASSTRVSYPIDNSFPNKYFDLDRCFSINRININGSTKQLVIINSHMSAYDEGGKIRKQQLSKLNEILTMEYNKGNYVIAGGDFNHDIANSLNLFKTEQEVPNWVFQLNNSDLPNHFSFASATDDATCRSTDIPYTKNVNYTVVIDGFVVSDNVTVNKVTNLVNGTSANFNFSDHNPSTLTFTLN